jgi:predicted nucleic-acid-binding protein
VIALDTNVLVRFLVEDDAAQTKRARAIIARAIDDESGCFVPEVVMCEVVWVLSAAYRIPKSEIVHHLGSLLRARHFAYRAADELARALEAFSEGRGDFADYLIRESSVAAGCEGVATFDKALHAERGFRAV